MGEKAYAATHSMRRRLFTILSVLSLMLCIASAGMWVRSSRHADSVAWDMPYHVATVVSSSGGVYLEWLVLTFEQQAWRAEAGLEEPAPRSGWRLRAQLRASTELEECDYGYRRRRMGFWWSNHDPAWNSESSPFVSGWQVGAPYWAIILLTLIAPVRAGVYWHRNRRRSLEGLCPRCGYDLRASKDRCPECGMLVPAGQLRKSNNT